MKLRRGSILVCSALAAAVLCLYGRTASFGFVNLDDDTYVSENRHVLAGLSGEGARWAFGTLTTSNWHPLTWLSLQADAQLHGARAGGYHVTNAALHALAAALLFLALLQMTDAARASAIAAALWALHPLRVESVAWIAERKDVLSGVFLMATLLAYASHAKRPGAKRMVWVGVLFALGLLAKPMLVTLPFLLLLLDVWPLGRVSGRRIPPWRLVAEKAPLFVLAAASCVVTWIAQHRGGAASSLEAVPVADRLVNAAVSFGAYLAKAAWPSALAVFYPHPSLLDRGMAPGHVALAATYAVGIVAVTALALHQRGRRSWLAVGWLWYLGTLVPVIGLVQVGMQAMADRYTYVPAIGISIIVAWGLEEILETRPVLRRAASVALLAALSVVTWRQVGTWRDGITLYRHALEVTRDNYLVHNNLGVTWAERNRYPDALPEYEAALRIRPDYPEAHTNMGIALDRAGRSAEALPHLREAVRLEPESERFRNNLGSFLERRDDLPGAREQYEEALRIRPDYAHALFNLGLVLAKQGDLATAETRIREALRLEPWRSDGWKNLGTVCFAGGRLGEAEEHYRTALRMQPDDPDLYEALADVTLRQGKTEESARFRDEARRRGRS